MALGFAEIQAVNFGKMEVMPEMDQELRLRVQTLEMKPSNREHIIDILSQCFPSKREEVKEFMSKNMSLEDFVRLQMYLGHGPNKLVEYDRQIDRLMDKELEKAVSASKNQGNGLNG